MKKKPAKKKTANTKPPEQVAAEKAHAEKVKQLDSGVREHIGDERLRKLSTQPQCLAKGGIDTVIETACGLAAGYPQPLCSGVVMTLQACGSKAKPEDLALSK